MKSAHKIGVSGRFSFPDRLLETADHYGLSVEHIGHEQYRLRGPDTDISKFIPELVDAPESVFSRKSLRVFLEFLHQPLRVVAEKIADGSGGSLNVHQSRTELHRFLRFAVTGSVEIPADTFDGLDSETAECHAKTEQAMRDADGWIERREIGNSDTAQSVLPRTEINKAGGFVFHIDRKTLGLDPYSGKFQKILNERFWGAINTATNGRYAVRTPDIVLSARELEKVCALALSEPLSPLLERVEFEEAVQQKLESLETRTRSLEHSFTFRRLQTRGQSDCQEHVHQMMRCTSALAPVMDSKQMQKAWARHHFMERHESPLAGLSKEYGVFLAVMDHLAAQGPISASQTEALAHEFLPLISFSEHFLQTMQSAAEQSGTPDQVQTLRSAREVFQNSSVTGMLPVSDALKDDYQQTLSVLSKSLHRSGGAVTQTARAGVDTALDFTMDVVNFIRESPKVAATFAGLATTLYIMNGGDQQAAQTASDTIMLFDAGGYEEVAIDFSTLPEEARDVQNWHWDMGPFGLYKHYMFDNAVVGPAQAIMDWTRIGVQWGYQLVGLPVDEHASFSQAADQVIKPLADQLFQINIFQNFSHAAFWMYMVSKGYNHGLKGANRIFELLSPLTNLSVEGAHGLGEILHLKKRTSVSERLQELGFDYSRSTSDTNGPRYEGVVIKIPSVHLCSGPEQMKAGQCIIMALARAAKDRAFISYALPGSFSGPDASLSLPKLKRKFEMNAQTLPPLLKALDGLDLAMTHAAAQIGVQEPWKKNFVLDNIDALRLALRQYSVDQNVAALQTVVSETLEDLAGAELLFAGRSKLHDVLGGDAGTDEQKKLYSFANARFGQIKRAERVERLKDRLASGHLDGQPLALSGVIKTRAMLYATHVWGAMVEAASLTRKALKPLAHKTTVIALAGLTAGAVALDMAGAGNGFTDAISSGAGSALAAASTSLTFLLYNFWEDVLGVHVGSGAVLLAAGAAAGYLAKRGLKPTALVTSDFLREKTGLDPVSVWDRLALRMEKAAGELQVRLARYNIRAGEALHPKRSTKMQDTQQDGMPSAPLFPHALPEEDIGTTMPDCEHCPYHKRDVAEREPLF